MEAKYNPMDYFCREDGKDIFKLTLASAAAKSGTAFCISKKRDTFACPLDVIVMHGASLTDPGLTNPDDRLAAGREANGICVLPL